jgi:hypothetical protein
MKTEDELDAEIAKLFDEVTTTKVEMVNGKPRVTDEQTIAEMDFAEACDDYVRAARCRRRFRRASVVRSKPAICGHLKTGHRSWPGT